MGLSTGPLEGVGRILTAATLPVTKIPSQVVPGMLYWYDMPSVSKKRGLAYTSLEKRISLRKYTMASSGQGADTFVEGQVFVLHKQFLLYCLRPPLMVVPCSDEEITNVYMAVRRKQPVSSPPACGILKLRLVL